ncbi:hypothetical protein DWH60_24695 [Escherichia coli]|nr:hypothetical protein [Escherichia coli]
MVTVASLNHPAPPLKDIVAELIVPIDLGVSSMFLEPSNDTPLIVRAVCNFVAVAALPVVF